MTEIAVIYVFPLLILLLIGFSTHSNAHTVCFEMNIQRHCIVSLTWPMRNEQSKSFPIDFCFSLFWCRHWGVFHKALFIARVLLWNGNYNRGRKTFHPSLSKPIQLRLGIHSLAGSHISIRGQLLICGYLPVNSFQTVCGVQAVCGVLPNDLLR